MNEKDPGQKNSPKMKKENSTTTSENSEPHFLETLSKNRMNLPMVPDVDLRSVPLPRSSRLDSDMAIASVIEAGYAKTVEEARALILEEI